MGGDIQTVNANSHRTIIAVRGIILKQTPRMLVTMWWRKKRNFYLILVGLIATICVILFKFTGVKEAKVGLLPLSSSMSSRKLWKANPKNQSSKCYQVDLEKLNSIYLSVKTSKRFHQKRLAPLLVTWMQALNPHQVRIDVINVRTVVGKSLYL